MSGDDLHAAALAIAKIGWPFLGGLGGAIVSLGLQRNEKLTPWRKAFTVMSGTILAVFVGPLIVLWTLGPAVRADNELVGAIYCLTGLASTALIEKVVGKIGDAIDLLPLPRKDAK